MLALWQSKLEKEAFKQPLNETEPNMQRYTLQLGHSVLSAYQNRTLLVRIRYETKQSAFNENSPS